MPQTYHNLGFKVSHVDLSLSLIARTIRLSVENPKLLLLEFPALADLYNGSTHFLTAARIFVPVKLLDSFYDDIENVFLCRQVDCRYSVPITSLIPLDARNSAFSIDEESKFASYFTPDDTTVPAFLYKIDRNSPLLLDFKDVLQPLN
jgi:hypothetical protein